MKIQRISIQIFCFLFLPFYLQANIIYVNYQAGGFNNGSTWTDAYTDLQNALTSATEEDEIWVAQGTYRPTNSADRTIEFEVTNSVEIYGGFIGNEASREERDWTENTTVLSGDIGVEGDSLDNSYTVVFMDSVDSTTVLDGFRITEGQADLGGSGGSTSNSNSGGGLFLYTNGGDVDPLIQNCTIIKNVAVKDGGGVMVYTDLNGVGASKAIFNQCSFVNNKVLFGGGDAIGCTFRITKGDFIMENCIFKDMLGGRQIISMLSLDNDSEYAIKFLNNTIQNCSTSSFVASLGSFGFSIVNELSLRGKLVIDNLLVEGITAESNTVFYIRDCKTIELTNSEIRNSDGKGNIIQTTSTLALPDTSKIIIINNSFLNINFPNILSSSGRLDITIENNIFKSHSFVPTNLIPTSYAFYFEYNDIANFLNYKINIKNNIFYNNTGKIGYFNYTDLIFENNTIIQQSPIDNLFTFADSTNILSFKNNIFDNINLPDSLSYFDLGEEISMNIANNLFSRPNCATLSNSPNFSCEDNNLFSQSPLFTDTLNGDFTLLPCSPGVNQGQNITPTDSLDFYQNPRVQDDIIDMGAVETFPILLDSFLSSSTACAAFSNGTIEAYFDNACLPLTYLWENGTQSGEGNTGLSAGNYDFTITDARGSRAQLNLDIFEEQGIAISSTILNASTSTAMDGSILINQIIGGTAPYDLTWENGEDNLLYQNIPAGIYPLSVTDSNGCTLDTSFVVSFNTSIQNTREEQEVFVFPNPTEDYLTITSKKNISLIKLKDAQGRLISSIHNGENQIEWRIFIGDLVSGIYFLTFWDESEIILKERVRVIKI